MSADISRDRIDPQRVVAATGRDPEAWFALLDAAGAAELRHRAIAAHLVDEHEVPGWWAQYLAVAYERARGRRLRHETPDGFSISRSKTMLAPVNQVFHALVDDATRARWLDVPLEVTSSRPEKSVNGRLPLGRVTISVTAKGELRTTVSVGHLKLPDAAAAEQAKADWTARLQRLADLVS